MSEPFLAEIRMLGFNFAPRGWAFLDGQILPIEQNQNLYSLLGTTYGGDGRTSFALPDLRGRTPIHEDGSHPLGQKQGQEGITLSVAEMPAHSHAAHASSADANTNTSPNNIMATEVGNDLAYGPANDLTSLQEGTVGNTGGSQPHSNMQPYLCVNFCIALQGLFPSRN